MGPGCPGALLWKHLDKYRTRYMAGMGTVPEVDFRELPREPRPQRHKWGYLRQLHRQTGLDLGFLKMQGITGTNLVILCPPPGYLKEMLRHLSPTPLGKKWSSD